MRSETKIVKRPFQIKKTTKNSLFEKKNNKIPIKGKH